MLSTNIQDRLAALVVRNKVFESPPAEELPHWHLKIDRFHRLEDTLFEVAALRPALNGAMVNSAGKRQTKPGGVSNLDHLATGSAYDLFHRGLWQRQHPNGTQLQPVICEGVRYSHRAQQPVSPAPQLQPVAQWQVHRHLKNKQTAGSEHADHVRDQRSRLLFIRLVL